MSHHYLYLLPISFLIVVRYWLYSALMLVRCGTHFVQVFASTLIGRSTCIGLTPSLIVNSPSSVHRVAPPQCPFGVLVGERFRSGNCDIVDLRCYLSR